MPSYQLRKLYTPPVRGLIFPSKNPFFNGKIVDFVYLRKNDGTGPIPPGSDLPK
jgi:hypothetical protein